MLGCIFSGYSTLLKYWKIVYSMCNMQTNTTSFHVLASKVIFHSCQKQHLPDRAVYVLR